MISMGDPVGSSVEPSGSTPRNSVSVARTSPPVTTPARRVESDVSEPCSAVSGEQVVGHTLSDHDPADI